MTAKEAEVNGADCYISCSNGRGIECGGVRRPNPQNSACCGDTSREFSGIAKRKRLPLLYPGKFPSASAGTGYPMDAAGNREPQSSSRSKHSTSFLDFGRHSERSEESLFDFSMARAAAQLIGADRCSCTRSHAAPRRSQIPV